MESLWLKVGLKNEKIIIGCIYRHPDAHLEHFNDVYSKFIQSLSKTATIIIGGDFNIDLLQFEKTKINEFLTNNLENNFVPCITLPTRITEKTATLIDHIFLRLPMQKMQTKVEAGNLFCSITDHLMNFILLEINTKNTKERPYVRLFTKHRIEHYLRNAPNDQPLLPENPCEQTTNENIHFAFSGFIKNFKKCKINIFL